MLSGRVGSGFGLDFLLGCSLRCLVCLCFYEYSGSTDGFGGQRLLSDAECVAGLRGWELVEG